MMQVGEGGHEVSSGGCGLYWGSLGDQDARHKTLAQRSALLPAT
jgi:hypothetical protein